MSETTTQRLDAIPDADRPDLTPVAAACPECGATIDVDMAAVLSTSRSPAGLRVRVRAVVDTERVRAHMAAHAPRDPSYRHTAGGSVPPPVPPTVVLPVLSAPLPATEVLPVLPTAGDES